MRIIILLIITILLASCHSTSASLQPKQVLEVRDSVTQLAASIAKDVSQEGPVAWLRYFENTPRFFMAVEGQLVFPNYDSAQSFINNSLIKSIRKINLHWSHIRIDPLTIKEASFAATFHEDITDSAGKETPQDGYFTSIAQHTPQGWKLLNAHWSIMIAH